MAATSPTPTLDPRLAQLLSGLRRRVRRYVLCDGLLAVMACILAGFWLGLALDYLPVLAGGTEMPRSARLVWMLVVLGLLIYLLVQLILRRLRRPMPDESLALLLERQHANLEGRLLTTVQLTAKHRTNDAQSSSMLAQVQQQVLKQLDQIDIRRVLRWTAIRQKLLAVVPLTFALVGLLVARPAFFSQAAGRLLLLNDSPWPRQAKLEMVGLEIPRITATEDNTGELESIRFSNRVARIARGSNATLRIRALADAAVVPDVCTMFFRTQDGTRGQANLRRVGRIIDGYQAFVLDGPPLGGLSGDLTFSIRGLDARLDDYVIQTVPPPGISQLQVEVTYPRYLRANTDTSADAPDLTTNYQPGLRIREGSTLVLQGLASKPLAEIDILVTSGDQQIPDVPLGLAPDGEAFQLVLPDIRQPTSVVLLPVDRENIAAQVPLRYFFGVVRDMPPEVQLRLKGIDTAITPQARLPAVGTIRDDYGVAAAELSVVLADELTTPPTTQPLMLDRDGKFSDALDLRELTAAGRLSPLMPGQTINVFAEATDGYDLGTPHLTRSEVLRLSVVTNEQLLALLERRELALRSRLEQTINDTQALRDSLDLLQREGWEAVQTLTAAAETTAASPDEPTEGEAPTGTGAPLQAPSDRTDADRASDQDEDRALQRARQVLLLRIQQAGLQAIKTGEEVGGLATSIDDLLEEMVNNRVDSVDRRQRLAAGVSQPLRTTRAGPVERSIYQIQQAAQSIDNSAQGQENIAVAVRTVDQVLRELTAVLEKMLDLESYNEILDLLRSLMETQDAIIEDTQEERDQRIRDLFK